MKKAFKKILPYLLIVLAIILLGIAITVVLQFNFKKEKLQLDDPNNPVEKNYNLDNQSDMSDDEIEQLVNYQRDDLMNFFDPIKYYKISEIDETYDEKDDEEYMVLTNEFTDNLKMLVTEDLFDKLTTNFEELKEEDNITYYKVDKDEFIPIRSYSAVAKYDYSILESHPIYASNDKISSIIVLKICNDEITELCRRNDEYQFELIKEDEEWKINDIGLTDED